MADSGMEARNGWLYGTKVLASDNYDDRPPHCEVELVIIHAISLPPEQFGGGHIEKFFTNSLDWNEHKYFEKIRDLRVSSHLLVDRLGGVLQFVDLNKRAWHAGKSAWEGRNSCNDFSIGIELEGSDSQPYEREQYSSLAGLLVSIFGLYPRVNIDAVVGHCDVSPNRKTDPGPFFDWDYLRAEIAKFS